MKIFTENKSMITQMINIAKNIICPRSFHGVFFYHLCHIISNVKQTTWHFIKCFGNDSNNQVSPRPMRGRESKMLSNLKQFGVDLMMLLLLLLILLLNCLLLYDVPRGLTHCFLFTVVVLIQNAVKMCRYILIGNHFILKSVSHQQITGFLVTSFGAVL